MRIIIFLSILTGLNVSANVYSQSTKLSLKVEDITVRDLLKIIETKSNIRFFFSDEMRNLNRKVSLSAKNETIDEILNNVLSDGTITYKVLENNIVVITPFESLQNQKVTGTITDATNGEPIIGANVTIVGTTIGVVTDANGKFILDISQSDAVLQISFLGYNSERIAVNGQSVLDVKLVPDITKLEEVVVIGYGTVKKQDYSGSVSTIKSEVLSERAITSLGEAFAGQVAGVRAQELSGMPGSEPLIKIRGIHSINASNRPLYVIDGIPSGGIENFNPNDIASIEVLKDASSAAIYGARGANGVILISTKKGSGKPSFSFETFYGLQQVDKILPMMNRDEWIGFSRYQMDLYYLRSGGSLDDPLSSRPSSFRYPESWLHPETLPDINWQKEILQIAPIQSYQLTVSGGGEMGSFLLSGSYMEQEGIMKYTGYRRINLRLNTTLNVGKHLKLGMDVTPSFSTSNNPNDNGYASAQHFAVNTAPILPLRSNTQEWGYTEGVLGYINPLAVLTDTEEETKINKLFTNVWGELNISKSLIFRSQLGYNYREQQGSSFVSSNIRYGSPSQGNASSSHNYDWSLQNTLAFSPKVSSAINMDILLGQSLEGAKYYSMSTSANGYPNDLVTTLNAASTPLSASTAESRNSLASFFGRLNLIAKDRYILTVNARRDGSSKFGRDTKWGWFPSVSAGWKINKENFMQNTKWIDLLKLRASIGKAGNDGIGDYGSVSLLRIANYNLGGALINGLAPSSLANPDLGWETKVSKTVGLDFNAFNSRIQASIDYYNDETKDMLLNVNVPYVSGYSSVRQNLGKIQNRGWEFELTTNQFRGGFNWATSFNISRNRNEVKQLGPDKSSIFADYAGRQTYITKIGESMGSFYMYKNDGLLLDKDFDLDGNPLVPIYPGQEKGNYKIVDINKDGKINEEDKTIVGNNQPDFVWGLNNRFSYKNFELNILLQGNVGGKVFYAFARHVSTGDAWGVNQYASWLRQWRPTDELPIEPYTNNGKVDLSWDGKTVLGMGEKDPLFCESMYLSDATFTRIKNISLAYNLPKSFCKRICLGSARIYVMGDNVYTFTNYWGTNPETNSAGTETLSPGTDYGTYPLARKYSIGINLTF